MNRGRVNKQLKLKAPEGDREVVEAALVEEGERTRAEDPADRPHLGSYE